MNEALGEEKWKDIDSAELMKKISEGLDKFFGDFKKTFEGMYQNLLDLIRIINDPSWKNLRNIWKKRQAREEERIADLTEEERKDERFLKTVKGAMPGGTGLVVGVFKEELLGLKKSSVETGKSLMKKLGDSLDSIGKETKKGNVLKEESIELQKNEKKEIIVYNPGQAPTTTIPDEVGDKHIDAAPGGFWWQ